MVRLFPAHPSISPEWPTVKLISNLSDLTEEFHHGAVTIGNFDGVHRGHVQIFRRVRELAAQCGGPAIAFTFDPHPVTHAHCIMYGFGTLLVSDVEECLGWGFASGIQGGWPGN